MTNKKRKYTENKIYNKAKCVSFIIYEVDWDLNKCCVLIDDVVIWDGHFVLWYKSLHKEQQIESLNFSLTTLFDTQQWRFFEMKGFQWYSLFHDLVTHWSKQ